MPTVLRYTAFSTDPDGGNPAGIVWDADALSAAEMQAIAADVDYAETAFVSGLEGAELSIRYFSPIAEVPFCGHATIATAVALVEHGLAPAGDVLFHTPVGDLTIRATAEATASFTSVPPLVGEIDGAALSRLLDVLGLSADDLDPRLPSAIADAGNPHPTLALADRAVFDGFTFDADRLRTLMDAEGWPATVTVLHVGEAIEARNLFPVGRITEDPATGSAAAATGAYLRERGFLSAPASFVIRQGAHVGRPSELHVTVPVDGGVTVAGSAVRITR